jgi:hypothetical protein
MRLRPTAHAEFDATMIDVEGMASMYLFVSSPAHRQAIAKVGLMNRGESIVTSWADDERGAHWSKALERLSQETRPTY